MFLALAILLLLQRLTELFIAERNRRWALEQGGIESGQWHYPLIVALHAFFYVSLIGERMFFARGWNPGWPVWLVILALTQAARVWCIASLGRSWNTRIIVIPGATRVVRGPYRYVRHPNYVVVAAEIFVIPVLCGAYLTAAVFSILNAGVLAIRIREENRALDHGL